MRLLFYLVGIGFLLSLAACQDQNNPGTPPSPTPVVMELTPPSAGERPAAAANDAAAKEIPGELGPFEITREDALALLNGRLLLTVFLRQTEGIPAPLADQWALDKVEQGDGGRRFTFKSEAWLLMLEEPGPEAAGILYHAQLAQPDGTRYIADIMADGSITPAQ